MANTDKKNKEQSTQSNGAANARNINLVVKSEEEKGDEIVISFSAFWDVIKRFILLWLVVAIVAGIGIPVLLALTASDQHKNLNALVSFNYDGIEKGLAPDGTKFDPYSLKSPTVIEAALTELNEPIEELENIRQGITITSVIPEDVIDEITVYKSVYEQGDLNAGEKLLATSYYATQYKVTFNYAKTGYSAERAAEVINMILDKYTDYFFDNYGYNRALGNAVNALDYRTYDYAQAIDVFDSSLSELQSYVSNLNRDDTSRFRSSQTGFTFADLYQAIVTLRTVDLDLISSYVTVNTVTKDKATLLDYYNYQIEKLVRERTVAQEKLNSINDSISKYEKDTIIIYGDMQETSQYTQASTQYDNMIKQKIDAQNTVSTKTSAINMYQQRINTLKGSVSATQEKMDKVEQDLEELNGKVTDLLDKVNVTADEYYETVSLANSYSVLVPASASGLSTTKSVIRASIEPTAIAEALLFILFFCGCFVLSLVETNRKKPVAAAADDDDDADDEDDAPADAEA